MKLSLRKPLAASLLLLSAACSSPPDQNGGDAATPDVAADVPVQTLACTTPVPASKCATPTESSVIRGVVTFDPTHFSAGENVNLAIYLYHQWTMSPSEATLGGHPHAYKYIKGVDVTTGQLAFDIDLCELGVAMYSEENGGFNLVVMFDENGDNNPMKGEAALTPTKGELVKLTPLAVSCHGDSQCLQITADCTGGTQCTTFTPIAMNSIVCAADKCPSESVVCHDADAGTGSD
jgi:hypothetical protein